MSQQMSNSFFFTKFDGTWSIGGESGAAQKIVSVSKRNGEVRKVKLGNELGKGWNDCTVYQLKEDITDSQPQQSSTPASGACWIWNTRNEEWCIKTRTGYSFGTEITATKRNGEKSTAILEEEIAEGIYRAHTDKFAIIDGGCWECGNPYYWRNSRYQVCTACDEEQIR